MSKAVRNSKRLAAFSLLLFSACALAAPATFAQTQQQQSRGLTVQATDKPDARPTGPQTFHALVIGINEYQNLNKLKTAESDAKEVAALLEGRFGFKVKLLLNATRQQILSELNNYRRDLGENASLLIYYAGHGYNDSEVDKAYWLPADARADDNSNWISADDITTNTKGIHARHVLIVSDSCYSGTIVRDADVTLNAPTEHDRYLEKMIGGKSRTLMASGGNEPVADGGGSGHSVFAKALLAGIEQMGQDRFTAGELFRAHIVENVAGTADQTPEYSPLRNSGHESGDFVFVRIGGAAAQQTQSGGESSATRSLKPAGDSHPAAAQITQTAQSTQPATTQATQTTQTTQAAAATPTPLPENLTSAQYSELGDRAMDTRRWADAERAYRAALRLTPNRPMLHISLADALISQQRYTEAEAEARIPARAHPDMLVPHMRLARALELEGKYADAEPERREAIRIQPDSPPNHWFLARDLLKLGKPPDAEAEARAALRLKPDDAKLHNLLGVALRSQNKLQEAEAEFTEAARLSPSNLEFQINMKQTAARLKTTP
jgi:Tfp pilus assembly protein PilF